MLELSMRTNAVRNDKSVTHQSKCELFIDCGNGIANGGFNATLTDCNMACTWQCRGTLFFWSGVNPPPPPTIIAQIGTWTSLGCYSDNVNGRALPNGINLPGSVTNEACTAAFCGNSIVNGGAPISASTCNMVCNGNSSEFCGGPNALNIYNNTAAAAGPPPPVITPQIGNWTSLGCYTDNVNGRALPNGVGVTGQMTNAACTSACSTADCGNAIVNGGAPATASDCNMVCAGNSSEFCGGPNRLNVYNNTGAVTANGGPGGIGPVLTGLPGTWSYNACWVDNAFGGRILLTSIGGTTSNTIQSCIAGCQSQNFTVAGTEYSDCGNELANGAAIAPQTDCSVGCSGNATEACGGPNRVSVYSSHEPVIALPVPTTQKTGLPGAWSYAGCLQELPNARVFPYKNIWLTNNSAVACMNQCAAFGYPAAGVEYGQECYCGDLSDVSLSTFVPESQCNMACTGDPIHFCGAGNLLTTYTWNGTMNVWHTPAVTGCVIVPLIATVGINNKVTFLEKFGTGPPNTTGAYELDLSLVPNLATAWREMHTKTDVFCSGSLILPDKKGRQINVGGWSLDSTFGVRFYTPDGSSGVNGTNDWEENWQEVGLQVGRWYPTAALLSNGSILVIGGEIGSNGPPEPTLELLPTAHGGNTTVYLDWLQRTDPNNLYPFVIVLPSGGLFVGYYNEARIIDQTTFQTVKVLPNSPSAVNNFLGGRNYPLEGSMMPWPQHAPYTDPLRVMMCGGSTPGPGIALDNCVHIEPDTPGATWTLERMPSQRVLTCMVALPDGTIDPNLNAQGQRFSIMNNTILPRMYHSEATLLPDASILISGSDPLDPRYPEEYRIERYVPPYLARGLAQPKFSIQTNDWSYNGQYQITNVQLSQGTTATMRVSLIAATSSTHGNAMGARTLFPAFSCTGTTCTITAPLNNHVCPPGWFQLFILDGPTPSHSQWVRIGGDPGQLGLWPNAPGFTPPGI
ncbi:glyoxal oxidase N-terminus-domain-containing protein [Amanita rubescens]|nr:glyoxal oxidase N-terminus-domain-containing protein [Amanita rubescens]